MIIGGKIFKIEVDESLCVSRILEQDEKIFWEVGYEKVINGIRVINGFQPNFLDNTLWLRGFDEESNLDWFSIPENKIEDLCRVAEILNQETIDCHEIYGKKDLLQIVMSQDKKYFKVLDVDKKIFDMNFRDVIDGVTIGRNVCYTSYYSLDLDPNYGVWRTGEIGLERLMGIIEMLIEKNNNEYWRVK